MQQLYKINCFLNFIKHFLNFDFINNKEKSSILTKTNCFIKV